MWLVVTLIISFLQPNSVNCDDFDEAEIYSLLPVFGGLIFLLCACCACLRCCLDYDNNREQETEAPREGKLLNNAIGCNIGAQLI